MHRFSQAHMPRRAAIEIARERILGVRSVLEQDLNLPGLWSRYPAEERAMPDSLEVDVSTPGAPPGRLTIRRPYFEELIGVRERERAHGNITLASTRSGCNDKSS
jgi:hypothetical protein